MPREYEDYIRDEERKHTPSNDEMLKKLDAYGHLNWTVGNEDWTACFDAVRHDDRIAYHVVVDCESGGFVDTVASGVIPVSKVDTLRNLPAYWASICSDNYLNDDQHGEVEWLDCTKAWNTHLDTLTREETSR